MLDSKTLSTIILALLVALTWWLYYTTTPDIITPVSTQNTPDYYLENFTATAMDSTGHPKYRLSAKLMQHFPQDDNSKLTQPHLIVYNPEKPPWHIYAQTGWVSSDGELILLLGDTLIQRKGTDTIAPVTIMTKDLRIQPEDNYIETEEFIKILSNENQVTATGMQGFYRPFLQIQLLSNVRGYYVNPLP